jgi:hypothetical protein
MAKLIIHGYALLIGVNENINPTWALPDVEKDVNALQNVLIHPDRCAYLTDNVKIILGKDSTRNNILEGLKWLKKKINEDASENATVVVFYSGHGHRDDNQSPQYYLIPYNVDAESIKSSALRAEDFVDAINSLKPERLFVVLDCCHSGGMGIKGVGVFRQSAIPSQIFISDSKATSPSEGAKELDMLTRGSGRAVLSSSKGEQYSYLRKDGTMSIFSYHLIEALTGHARPETGAKEVLVSDVMSYVWRKVPESAKTDWGKVQEPDYQVSGNFPIALLLGGKGISKGLPPPDPLEPLGANKATSVTKKKAVGGANIKGKVGVGGNFVGRDMEVHGDEVRGVKIIGDKINFIKNMSGGFFQPDMQAGVVQQAGHDINIHEHTKVGSDIDQASNAIAKLFENVMIQIQSLPIDEQTAVKLILIQIKSKLEEIQIAKIDIEAKELNTLEKWLRALINLTPDIADTILQTIANQGEGFVTILQKLAMKLND